MLSMFCFCCFCCCCCCCYDWVSYRWNVDVFVVLVVVFIIVVIDVVVINSRNLPLEFGRNRVSYRWGIDDVKILVVEEVGGWWCKVIFMSNTIFVIRLSWGCDNTLEIYEEKKHQHYFANISATKAWIFIII